MQRKPGGYRSPTVATRVLSLIPNAKVSEIQSGCCGVAGSFGYEAEHYDISLKIGEDRLLPAVREASASLERLLPRDA